jgi:hypothetical protein
MIFIEKVCHSLTKHGVRYAIVGGYAVALHGAVRGTMDVDIAVNWTLASLQNAERALQAIGLRSRIPVTAADVFHFREEYINKRNLVAWNFYNPNDLSELVDVIINFDLRGKTRKRMTTAAGPIQVLEIQSLIEMKRKSGREQDLEDVKALEKLK